VSDLAAALDVIGSRWALLIVERLLEGPQRYGDLQRDLGAPTNMLATRLRELQAAGLEYVRGPYYPSLAYRLVQIATGKLDATVVRRGSQDWDLAGAATILGECGIGFEDACGVPMRFNRADVRHGALAAFANSSLRDVLCGALIKVYGCPETQIDLERKTT
jgi:hypothetical protein